MTRLQSDALGGMTVRNEPGSGGAVLVGHGAARRDGARGGHAPRAVAAHRRPSPGARRRSRPAVLRPPGRRRPAGDQPRRARAQGDEAGARASLAAGCGSSRSSGIGGASPFRSPHSLVRRRRARGGGRPAVGGGGGLQAALGVALNTGARAEYERAVAAARAALGAGAYAAAWAEGGAMTLEQAVAVRPGGRPGRRGQPRATRRGAVTRRGAPAPREHPVQPDQRRPVEDGPDHGAPLRCARGDALATVVVAVEEAARSARWEGHACTRAPGQRGPPPLLQHTPGTQSRTGRWRPSARRATGGRTGGSASALKGAPGRGHPSSARAERNHAGRRASPC